MFLVVRAYLPGEKGVQFPVVFYEGPEKIGKSDVTSDAITSLDI
jgi:hypothetical protein